MSKNFGEAYGPERYRIGSPDWYATKRYEQEIASFTRLFSGPDPTTPVGTEQKAGSLLGAMLGIAGVFLILSGKASVGTVFLLFIVAGVVLALRKILFRLIGLAVVIYGLYLLLQ